MTKDYYNWPIANHSSAVFGVILETTANAQMVEEILRAAKQFDAPESAVERLLRSVEATGTEQVMYAPESEQFSMGFIIAARNFGDVVRLRVMLYSVTEIDRLHPLALADKHCSDSKLVPIAADDSVFI